jgi:murein DD-endopeptidase MepM/ murein hydrolase activator NlpD
MCTDVRIPFLAFRVPFPARGRVAALVLALAAVVVGCPGGVGPALAAPAPPPADVRFRWPLDGRPPVVRRFSPPPQPWLPGHRGVDLSADPGAAVYAAGPGTVRFAGQLGGRGVVSIDHADGLRTTYEPVVPFVAAGQEVRAGDMIASLGADHPGCAVEACLHWGLRRGETYLDPLALVAAARVRLLPLTVHGSAALSRERREEGR